MRGWERIEGGVRKYHDWGYVEVYAETENCFTEEELKEVLRDLDGRFRIDALNVEEIALLEKIKAHFKKRRKSR